MSWRLVNQDKKRGIVTYSLLNLIELKSTQTQMNDVEFLIMKRIYIYISYKTFWCVVSLSIFTNCTVF